LTNVVEHQSTSGTKIRSPQFCTRAVLPDIVNTGFTVLVVD